MGYGDVAGRGLIPAYDQYPGFRTENSVVAAWLGRMPFWPIANSQTLIREWDFGAVRLQKIAYHTEPGMSMHTYLLRPTAATAAPVPGILALHEQKDEYAAGKSEVVGLVYYADYPHLRSIPPEPSPHLPSARVPFAYARELAERGYIVLAPDFLGFAAVRQ